MFVVMRIRCNFVSTNKGTELFKLQKIKIMTNLLSTLSQELQTKLTDFKVTIVFIECGDVNVRSEYDMDFSYYTAIEKELSDKGHTIN
jgi:hypothetical protein